MSLKHNKQESDFWITILAVIIVILALSSCSVGYFFGLVNAQTVLPINDEPEIACYVDQDSRMFVQVIYEDGTIEKLEVSPELFEFVCSKDHKTDYDMQSAIRIPVGKLLQQSAKIVYINPNYLEK